MSTVALTDDNFEKTVSQDGITFVDFWAEWCGPCKAFAPVYEKVAEAHPDITFAKVNTEEAGQVAAEFQITAIPTLMIFRDGVPLFAQPGMLPETAIEQLIEQTVKLDMDEVRREIANKKDEEQAREQKTLN